MNENELRERLAAAERVCVLYGWSPARMETPREKALHQAWSDWAALPGTSTSPEDHPDLDDAEIARLAAKRDRIRAETLRKYLPPQPFQASP